MQKYVAPKNSDMFVMPGCDCGYILLDSWCWMVTNERSFKVTVYHPVCLASLLEVPKLVLLMLRMFLGNDNVEGEVVPGLHAPTYSVIPNTLPIRSSTFANTMTGKCQSSSNSCNLTQQRS